jgi:hypothetical protein
MTDSSRDGPQCVKFKPYQIPPSAETKAPLRCPFRCAKLGFVTQTTARRRLPAPQPRNLDRKFVAALGRGLDVLRCFGPRNPWLANQEIAAQTSLARPTVSRLR